MTGWGLPRTAEIGGKCYAIHADFRDVLYLLSKLGATDMDEETAVYVALNLFYVDFLSMPEADYDEAVKWLYVFLNGGDTDTHNQSAHKTIDWEQDRAMIVADVNKVAGCEIRALPFCHWWTFLAWFYSVGDGQLATVVSIREKRRKGKKLSDWEREFYQENRERVDFRKKYTAEELEEQENLKKLLGE